ncbi:MAG: type II toxin-antitoxin system prevent-host-death family antitoxin [Thermomicrobiales bacterium]|nr:type II toxin-antitoxin system prevent-host-death family antitoxin [Thermomicrobiales bacterium]
MSATLPTTETMKISDVKPQLNSLVNRVYRREARILVEKSGIPVAGIVSPRDMQRLEELDRQREAHIKAIDTFAAGFADLTPEEIEQETARAIAEVRAEQREAWRKP